MNIYFQTLWKSQVRTSTDTEITLTSADSCVASQPSVFEGSPTEAVMGEVR